MDIGYNTRMNYNGCNVSADNKNNKSSKRKRKANFFYNENSQISEEKEIESMSTLYELTNEYLEVLELAESGEVEADVIADTLESIGGTIEEKADNYAKLIKSLDNLADGIKGEEQRLAGRRKTIESNSLRIKKVLEQAMIVTNKKMFKTTLFSFGIQANPPRLVVDGEVPQEFLVPQPPTVDNARIKEELKTMELAFAHLEQSESLRIR